MLLLERHPVRPNFLELRLAIFHGGNTGSNLVGNGSLSSALAQNPGAPDPAQLTQAANSADAASGAVTKIITSVPVDQQFGNQDQVRRLLQEPIKAADALLRRGPIDIANGSGRGYCSQFASVINKYPFDPNSLQDASLEYLTKLRVHPLGGP